MDKIEKRADELIRIMIECKCLIDKQKEEAEKKGNQSAIRAFQEFDQNFEDDLEIVKKRKNPIKIGILEKKYKMYYQSLNGISKEESVKPVITAKKIHAKTEDDIDFIKENDNLGLDWDNEFNNQSQDNKNNEKSFVVKVRKTSVKDNGNSNISSSDEKCNDQKEISTGDAAIEIPKEKEVPSKTVFTESTEKQLENTENTENPKTSDDVSGNKDNSTDSSKCHDLVVSNNALQVIRTEKLENREQLEKAKNIFKKILQGASYAALVVCILIAAKGCGRNQDAKEEKESTTISQPVNTPTPTPFIEITTETEEQTVIEEIVKTISTIDINNDDEIEEIAQDIKDNYDISLSVEEIANAIRLINMDYRNDFGGFTSKQEVLKSTMDAGNLILTCGSDNVIAKSVSQDIYVTEETLEDILTNVTGNSLTITDFADAKIDNCYDIYKLCEICTNGMYGNVNAFNYAKAYNDIVARFEYNFSICSNSPIATICAITGMYNTSMDKTNELTAGQGLSTIYGDNIYNDGTYGSICVEELTKFLKIYNDNGNYDINEDTIYAFIIKDQILGASRTM